MQAIHDLGFTHFEVNDRKTITQLTRTREQLQHIREQIEKIKETAMQRHQEEIIMDLDTRSSQGQLTEITETEVTN